MENCVYTAGEIAGAATRIDNDVNGNPRYYIPVFMFQNDAGEFFRPNYCTKYRGKRYGAGWVFQSYNLEYDIQNALGGEA